MTYAAVTALSNDIDFYQRVNACLTQECLNKLTGQSAQIEAMARAVMLVNGPPVSQTLTNMIAAFPGLVDPATGTDGVTVDQTQITDSTILSQTQSNEAALAALFFDSNGNILPT